MQYEISWISVMTLMQKHRIRKRLDILQPFVLGINTIHGKIHIVNGNIKTIFFINIVDKLNF